MQNEECGYPCGWGVSGGGEGEKHMCSTEERLGLSRGVRLQENKNRSALGNVTAGKLIL